MLAELQRDFRSWLIGASDEAAIRLGGERAAAGLAVYQNNYRGQLVGCLREAYPQLRAWIGEERFLTAAITHIDNRPPHAWTLDAYGRDFGETLGSLFPHNPDLQELAWLEWALSEAFVAPDAEQLSAEALSAVDWDTARLVLAPSFVGRPVATNAADVWSALSEGRDPPESEMLDAPGGLIVWRQGFVCRFKPVEALEWDALLHLQGDGGFASLCALLVARLGEADGVAKAGALLGDWLGAGLIVGVEP
jgi:hypothetical protein